MKDSKDGVARAKMKALLVRLPVGAIEKLKRIAASETMATQYPVFMSNVIRKYVLEGIAAWDKLQGGRR